MAWSLAARNSTGFSVLLHKSDVRGGRGAFRAFLDCPILRLEARNVFAQRPPDAFSVAGADNNAGQQFALQCIGKHVYEIQRELFGVVVDHHQVAVQPLQFLFIGFDLNLSLRRCLFFVHSVSPVFPTKVSQPSSFHGNLALGGSGSVSDWQTSRGFSNVWSVDFLHLPCSVLTVEWNTAPDSSDAQIVKWICWRSFQRKRGLLTTRSSCSGSALTRPSVWLSAAT